MTLSISKGKNVSLAREAPGLTDVHVGLGWDEIAQPSGEHFDLNASAFMLTAERRVRTPADFIFYNHLEADDGSIEHTGDNRTGKGPGDDESLKVRLLKVPPDVQSIVLTVTIHDAEARGQNFGMVKNAFIRIVDNSSGREIVRFDLTEDMSAETAIIFGELCRQGPDWKFKAIGQGCAGGLAALCRLYGINV